MADEEIRHRSDIPPPPRRPRRRMRQVKPRVIDPSLLWPSKGGREFSVRQATRRGREPDGCEADGGGRGEECDGGAIQHRGDAIPGMVSSEGDSLDWERGR